MNPKKRKWLFAALRLTVCSVALAWVLHNVSYYDYLVTADGTRHRVLEIRDDAVTVATDDGSARTISCANDNCSQDVELGIEFGLKTTWGNADKSYLLLSFAVFAPVTLFQSLRFKLLLRAQDIRVSFWESVKLCYAGNFLNFVTALGSTGGDAFRMYYVSLYTKRKTEAATTVILDRVVGLVGLLLLVAVVALIRSRDGKMAVLGYGIGGILVAGLAAGVVLFWRPARRIILPMSVLAKLPFASHLQRMESATRRLAAHKAMLLGGLGCTLVLQFVAITSFVFVALALGMRDDSGAVWDYYAYLAGGMVVASIPISFQGLGTMEAFLKHAFLYTHGTLPAILCLAMTLRIIGLVWSLPGAIVTMTGAYRPRAADAADPTVVETT